ncbi:hypothetical protein [Profundibacter sp.]
MERHDWCVKSHTLPLCWQDADFHAIAYDMAGVGNERQGVPTVISPHSHPPKLNRRKMP